MVINEVYVHWMTFAFNYTWHVNKNYWTFNIEPWMQWIRKLRAPHCAFCTFGYGLLFGLQSFLFSSIVPLAGVFPYLHPFPPILCLKQVIGSLNPKMPQLLVNMLYKVLICFRQNTTHIQSSICTHRREWTFPLEPLVLHMT